MPLEIGRSATSMIIRRAAWERSGLARAEIDRRYNLTPDEFRVEGSIVVLGPIFEDANLDALIGQLEEAGLVYFEDYFELSGNWPEWLTLFASGG
jgi:hypothetical protein